MRLGGFATRACMVVARGDYAYMGAQRLRQLLRVSDVAGIGARGSVEDQFGKESMIDSE